MNFNDNTKYTKTLESVTEQFEQLRTQLHKFADNDSKFSDSQEVLALSKKLDELHLEYIRISEARNN